MSIIGTFPTTLTNGTIEDAAQVMIIFDWIKDQVNANAVAVSGGSGILALDNTWTGSNAFDSGFSIAFADFDSTTYAAQNLLWVDSGMYSGYSSSASDIIYGFASNVTRTGGNFHTVGAQFSGYAGANNSQATFGVVTQAINLAGFSSDIVGGEFAACNFTNNLNAKVGIDVVFKNRFDGQTAITGVLGSNTYNYNSKAIIISSQIRSTVGEYCGWKYGIKFDEHALDHDTAGGAIGIDFSAVHYYGGSDPTTAYRMSSAIRLRGLQSILWNSDFNSPVDPVSPVRTYLDEFDGTWKITNANLLRMSINVASGNMTFAGTATSAALLDITGCATLGGLVKLSSSNSMWSTAGLGGYAGKMKVIIDGQTKYIPVHS